MMKLARCIAVSCVMLCAGHAWADIINVPADVPTVAAAMAAAVDGDEIVIAAGTYIISSTMSVSVNNLTIRSASGNPADTIIDGNGSAGGMAIINKNGIVIDGLTFTDFTGAISMSGSEVGITGCRITENHADDGSTSHAIVATVCDLTVDGCTFDNNSFTGTGLSGGALKLFGGSASITDTIFDSNAGHFDGVLPTEQGGAILLAVGSAGGPFLGTDCTVTGCTFVDNSGEIGAAITGISSTLTVESSIFLRNHASLGGALFVRSADFGQGLLLGSLAASNCLFNSNSVERLSGVNGFGGAIAMSDNGQLELLNSTLVNNTSESAAGGVFLFTNAAATIDNSIFEGNTAPAYPASDVIVGYTIVNDPGVIFVDPDGADNTEGTDDDDFRLAAGSAGIDAGGNDVAGLLTVDLDGNPRFVDDPNTADTGDGPAPVIDLGAYEFQPAPDCLADVNHDGMVSPADFTAWIAAFNANAPECDQNNDGSCTPADFTAWIANFNAGCS